MPKQKRSATTWSACKAVIKDWPAVKIQQLVHELYKLSPENQRFLYARLFPGSPAEALADARKALRKILSEPAVLDERFSHAAAKRIVDQYAKVAEVEMVCDLLISDLEMSLRTFNKLGDDRSLVDHFYATLDRLAKLSSELSIDLLQQLSPRMRALAQKWDGKFGYGISDELSEFAAEWCQADDYEPL